MLSPRNPNSAPVEHRLARMVALLAVALMLTTMAATGARAASSIANMDSRYHDAALAAARKSDGRNTTISDLKVASGFAVASILNKSRSPQGYLAIFKVHSVRSMTVIASGSEIDPVELVELRIPFATQVKLFPSESEESLQHAVADEGQYAGQNTPGFSGFDGSFGPDGWELDAGTFDSLEAALSKAVTELNADANVSNRTIDVDAAYKLNRHNRFVQNFTLKLAFISSIGTFTIHTLEATYHGGRAGGVPAYYTYALDGHDI